MNGYPAFIKRHECHERTEIRQEEDAIPFSRTDDTAYINTFVGRAVSFIEQDARDGRWYATNKEYCSLIRFCPFCGVQL